MYQILFIAIPAVIGFNLGMVLTIQISVILAVLAIAFGLFSLFWTRNWEIGSFYGIIAMILAASFTVGLAIATGLVYGINIDFSWLIRSEVLNAN